MQRIGASYDYTEVDSDTIEFTYELASDDLVTMIVVSIDLYNPAWTNITEDLIPDADDTRSIGSILKTWKNFFTKTASSWNWATTTATAGYVPVASSTNRLDDAWQNISYANATDLTDGNTTTLHYHANIFATASAVLQASANTERSKSNDTNYTKVKEIVTNIGGSANIYFACKASGAAGNAKIYINDIAVGSEIACADSAIYTTSSATFYIYPGSRLQAYYKTFNTGGTSVTLKDFQLSFTTSTFDTLYNTITD
jgi:hypothetical protein